MSLNNSSYNFHLFPNYATPLTILNSLSSVIGTVGNMLVIMIIIKSSTLHRVTDHLILSLACADLIVVSVMEPLFTYHINYYTQTDGTLFDDVLDITGYVSNLASIGSILCVTFDRLIAIRFPLKYNIYLSKTRVILMITSTWICSTTFGIVFKLRKMHPAIMWGVCSMLLLGTLMSYPYIFYVARKQEKLIKQQTVGGRTSHNDTNSNELERNNPRRIISEKKSAKTVATVVGVFGACWIPILVYTRVKMAGVQTNADAFLPGFFVVYTMSMLNSTLNPFIYCVRNRRYRKELRARLFFRRPAYVGSRSGHDNKGHDSIQAKIKFT